jgi:hypothetical protein
MHTRVLIALAAVTVLGLTLAAPSTHASASPATPSAHTASSLKRCAGTFGPRGEPGHGFWRAVRTRGMSCRRAKQTLRAYLRTGGGREVVRGFRCRIRIVATRKYPAGAGRARCIRGRKLIKAFGSP